MTRLRSRTTVFFLLALLGPAGWLAAQDAPSAAAARVDSVPNPGEMIRLVDKATSPTGNAAAGTNDWSAAVKLAMVFSLLALLPSMLVMMTSFTRIVIVLSFLRRALTTQSIPPTIAIIGLALFLTLFTMAPVLTQMNAQGIQPYLNDEMTFFAAAEQCNNLLKEFMYRQTRPADLQLFIDMAKTGKPERVADIPSHVMIPAFSISEFRKAFEMGCLIFIPFLVIDLVTSGILLSAGMMMLPPAMISLPFKIILFVLVDGWRLVASTLVTSFN